METKNKEYIPDSNEKYIPRKINGHDDQQTFELAYKHKLNTMLVGETGTGKSHAVKAFCYKHKLPYMPVNLNEATTPDDLLGQIVPDGKGSFKWVDGQLTRFVRHGGVFVCEEINAANPGVLFLLNSILQEHRLVLVQKDGEVIQAHPDFWFIATMNPDYEGTKPLNKALNDRFPVYLYYDYDTDIEDKLINQKEIIKLAAKLRPLYAKRELMTPIGTRTLLHFQNNINIFGQETAIEMFLNKFERDEAESIRATIELLFAGKTKNKLVESAKTELGA